MSDEWIQEEEAREEETPPKLKKLFRDFETIRRNSEDVEDSDTEGSAAGEYTGEFQGRALRGARRRIF